VGQSSVDQHFNDVQVWSLDAAYMPSWGNHEWDTPSADDMRNYKGRFDLPNPQTSRRRPRAVAAAKTGPGSTTGTCASSPIPSPTAYSTTWPDWGNKAKTLMDQAQSDPNIKFIVTCGHRPP
jgi:hypothetical protein